MATLITFTSVAAGLYSDRIVTNLLSVVDGSTVAVSVAETDFNQYVITITVGIDGGDTLNVGNWAAVADLVNADPTAGALIFAVGTGETGFTFDGPAAQSLTGGAPGLGDGVYYFGVVPPSVVPVEVNLIFCGYIRYLVKKTGGPSLCR